MTMKKFYELLATTERKWTANKGYMRLCGACPITAVANLNSGPFPLTFWHLAARALGLNKQQGFRIADAADGCGHPITRRKLMKAIGLDQEGAN